MSVDGMDGCPTSIFRVNSTTRRRNRSWIPSCLPGVSEHPEDGGAGGRLHVSIVEDHVGGFASQLQAHPFHFLACLGPDHLAGACLAGEGDLVHLLVGDDLRADDIPGTGDQVEHALRETALLDELDQFVGGGRGVARRLDHDGAAGGESGGHFPGGLSQREVPGGDHSHHAHRLLDQVDHRAAGQCEALAIQLAGQSRVKIEDVGRGRDVGRRLAHRHPHFQAHHPSQTVSVGPHQTSGLKQRLLPELVVVDPVADIAVERDAGGVDRGASVLQSPLLGDGGNLADICRVLSLELSAARGLALFTVDDQGTVQWQPQGVIVCHVSLPWILRRCAMRRRASRPGRDTGLPLLRPSA
jgi:hypothetical protein